MSNTKTKKTTETVEKIAKEGAEETKTPNRNNQWNLNQYPHSFEDAPITYEILW